MILNALQGRPLPVYGDGRQVRDWLYVEDHCEAILCVLEAGQLRATYIGGSNQPCNLDLVRQICALLDERRPDRAPHERLITHVPDQPGPDLRYAMDSSRIQFELGWAPRRNLAEGLRLIVDWYLSHPEWVTSVPRQTGYGEWLEANFVQAVEERQGLMIGCPEEVAYRVGFIGRDELRRLVEELHYNSYGEYLLWFLEEEGKELV